MTSSRESAAKKSVKNESARGGCGFSVKSSSTKDNNLLRKKSARRTMRLKKEEEKDTFKPQKLKDLPPKEKPLEYESDLRNYI